MAYSPPRAGKGRRKQHTSKHTVEEDNKMFADRLSHFQRLLKKTPEADKAKRSYLEGEIKRLESKLKPREPRD